MVLISLTNIFSVSERYDTVFQEDFQDDKKALSDYARKEMEM